MNYPLKKMAPRKPKTVQAPAPNWAQNVTGKAPDLIQSLCDRARAMFPLQSIAVHRDHSTDSIMVDIVVNGKANRNVVYTRSDISAGLPGIKNEFESRMREIWRKVNPMPVSVARAARSVPKTETPKASPGYTKLAQAAMSEEDREKFDAIIGSPEKDPTMAGELQQSPIVKSSDFFDNDLVEKLGGVENLREFLKKVYDTDLADSSTS